MKKPDITAGDWRLGIKPGPYIYGDNGTQVAACDMITNFAIENIANSKAIAALPQCLNALNDAYESLSRLKDAEGAFRITAMSQARTALLAAGYTE